MMDYKTKSIITVAILLTVITIAGLLISQGDNLTGAFISSVACYDDADCNDKIDATIDICKNPGTSRALCINRPEK